MEVVLWWSNTFQVYARFVPNTAALKKKQTKTYILIRLNQIFYTLIKINGHQSAIISFTYFFLFIYSLFLSILYCLHLFYVLHVIDFFKVVI